MLNSIITNITTLLGKFNSTSIKRLIIYALLIYPIVILRTYHDEISMLLTFPNKTVKIMDVAAVQDKCFLMKTKHHAEAVMLYVYQPSGKNKIYKERMIFSAGSIYTPLPSSRILQLSANSRVLEDLKKQNYSYITLTSGHQESAILQLYNLKKAYITSIRDVVSDQIIAEVVWVFKDDIPIDVNELIMEGQIFTYYIPESK